MNSATYNHNILVIANETSQGGELMNTLSERMNSATRVMVVAPALNSRLRHLFSDIDPARRVAELRLAGCVEQLRRRGIEATGVVGDSDPLQAIDDSLREFDANELVISTHDESRSNWMAHDVVGRARSRFELPITHIEVGAAREAVVLAVAA